MTLTQQWTEGVIVRGFLTVLPLIAGVMWLGLRDIDGRSVEAAWWGYVAFHGIFVAVAAWVPWLREVKPA